MKFKMWSGFRQMGIEQRVAVILFVVFLSAFGFLMSTKGESDAEELYYEALWNTMSYDGGDVFYSFFSNTDGFETKGQLVDSGATNSVKLRWKMDLELRGVDVLQDVEQIVIDIGSQEEGTYYLRLNESTVLDQFSSSFDAGVRDYYERIMGQWVKVNPGSEDVSRPVGYDTHGQAATLSILGMLNPYVGQGQRAMDSSRVFDIFKDSGIYTIQPEIKKVAFQGEEARELTVLLHRDGMRDAKMGVREVEFWDTHFEAEPEKILEQTFGSNDYVETKVYIAADAPLIIGLAADYDLPRGIIDTSFNHRIIKGNMTVRIDRNAGVKIGPPEEYVLNDELLEGLDIQTLEQLGL